MGIRLVCSDLDGTLLQYGKKELEGEIFDQIRALHDRGILIPDEIRVITFDDYPFSQILRPMLSVVDIDVYDMGMQAGKYILQKICGAGVTGREKSCSPDRIQRI